jgi:ankyrin repeat protein
VDCTLLQGACSGSQVEVVELLLSRGIVIENTFRASPLRAAIAAKATDCARLLLEHGAKPHIPPVYDEEDGLCYPPFIHLAASSGCLEMVELLVEYGAPLDCRDMKVIFVTKAFNVYMWSCVYPHYLSLSLYIYIYLVTLFLCVRACNI